MDKSREKYIIMEDESDGEEIEITAAEVVEKLEEVNGAHTCDKIVLCSIFILLYRI